MQLDVQYKLQTW